VGAIPPVTVSRGLSTVLVERLAEMLFIVSLLPVVLLSIDGSPEWMKTAARLSGILAISAIVIMVAAANRRAAAMKFADRLLRLLPLKDVEPWTERLAGLLDGLDSLTRGASGIFAHSQLAMETVPTPQSDSAKILHTTGSVTEKYYSHSKRGKKAEFHHTLGGLVIEKEHKRFHLRQLVLDSEGGFFDRGRYWHPKGDRAAGRAAALVTGDTHVDVVDPLVVEATYGDGGIVEVYRPRALFWHDLLNFTGASHWLDPVERIALSDSGLHDIRSEMSRTVDFALRHTPRGVESYVVASNHNEHLARWVKSADWKTEHPDNAALLLELQAACIDGARVTSSGVEQIDPFAWWAQKHVVGAEQLKFLRRGDSYRVGGVELSFHGDVGPSGAKGSRRNLDRTGTRMVIAHFHAPGVWKGVWQVGTSSLLDLVYARKGPGSWMHTHCVVWPNGKRQLINIIEGHWRALW
jgi:hypothetical protein